MPIYKGVELPTRPTEGMKEEARRYEAWREEGYEGGTQVAAARANQILAGDYLSVDTVKRMHSFFARHEVDKEAEGFRPGEDGYPSPGRVAWAAWGGDPGQSFARRIVEQIERIDEQDRDQGVELEYRAATIENADVEERTMDLSVSSEFGVEREFGMEVLSHDDGAIDMSRLNNKAPLLLDHDMRQQIGVVEKAYIDPETRRLRATVRFGRNALANDVLQDVKDGIRTNVSIGYRILDMERMNDSSGTVVVRSWLPHEISVVSVPADPTVGFGRSIEKAAEKSETKTFIEVKTMSEINTDELKAQAAEAAKREFQQTAKEITALAVRHNRRDLADQAITDGLSIDQFRGMLLDSLPEGKPLERTAGDIDMSQKEVQQYSFMKAVRGLVNGSGLTGFEKEMSDEIAKRAGKEAQGFYAPDQFWSGLGKRDLTVGTDSAGGFLRPTDHLGDQFVDALRARTVLSNVGARFMSGLRGDVAIPKLAGGASAAFVGENSAVAEQNPTFAQVTMSPKTLGAFVDISRLLMIQSDPSVEQIIRDDLLNALAQKIEDVAIEGAGSNEPTGILETSGIGSVALGTNGAAPTWASIVNLVREVEQDNAAINANALRFLTNPKVKAKLSQTAKVGSTDSVTILDDPWASMYGYGMEVTSNVPSDLTKGTGSALSALIFGDFSQLMIGLFSTADILIDPYTGGSAGTVRIRVMQEVDTAVRHAESFAAITDMITT